VSIQTDTPLSIELTVQQLADRTEDKPWSVRRLAAKWYNQQDNPTLPRVRLGAPPVGSKPCYWIDQASFERWAASSTGKTQRVGTPGCDCLKLTLDNNHTVALLDTECPIHGELATELRGDDE
jgi:hypothetical protein